MLGIDAASIDVIRANTARLPSFRRVLEAGNYRPLKSWGDVASGSVWPSFAVGKQPGEHGIYHHIQWNSATMRLQSSDLVSCFLNPPRTFVTAPRLRSHRQHPALVPAACRSGRYPLAFSFSPYLAAGDVFMRKIDGAIEPIRLKKFSFGSLAS